VATVISMPSQAFEELVRTHHRMVLAYLRSLLPDHAPIEDLAQECFLVAFRRQADIDPERDFGRWLRGIARMQTLAWWRQRREQPLSAEQFVAIEERYATWFEPETDMLGDLSACLELLSDVLRQAVQAFYLDQLSIVEAAARLGIGGDAFKKRLQRAREELAACLARRRGSTP